MKGTYELLPGEFEETYSIFHIEPGQFEVYIDLRNEQEMNKLFKSSSYYKERPIEEWTTTSS